MQKIIDNPKSRYPLWKFQTKTAKTQPDRFFALFFDEVSKKGTILILRAKTANSSCFISFGYLTIRENWENRVFDAENHRNPEISQNFPYEREKCWKILLSCKIFQNFSKKMKKRGILKKVKKSEIFPRNCTQTENFIWGSFFMIFCLAKNLP